MIDAKELEAAVDDARKNKENIELPEYTFDCHTTRGRRKGKTKDDFFNDEFHALQPRETGEFDHVVAPAEQPIVPND